MFSDIEYDVISIDADAYSWLYGRTLYNFRLVNLSVTGKYTWFFYMLTSFYTAKFLWSEPCTSAFHLFCYTTMGYILLVTVLKQKLLDEKESVSFWYVS